MLAPVRLRQALRARQLAQHAEHALIANSLGNQSFDQAIPCTLGSHAKAARLGWWCPYEPAHGMQLMQRFPACSAN